MREIKFRVWHPSLKCMSEVLELDFQHDAIRCIPGHLPKNRLSDVILMQFTGILDRKETEVFENDVVAVYDFYGKEMGRYEIRYATFGFTMYDPSRPGEMSYYSPHMIEVIGNVYQNPELSKSV